MNDQTYSLQKHRGNRRYRHTTADSFAILVDDLVDQAYLVAPHLTEHAMDIRQYPEAMAMVESLERALGELRRLATAVKDGPRSCSSCGAPIGGRADARFCSARCRQRDRRSRL